MKTEYYGFGPATTPTDDFLAHYGVRGMKWGVRKAMYKGSDRAFAKVYKKASKKLKKLEKRADLNYQKNAVEYHRKKGLRSAAGALASEGGGLGALALHYSKPSYHLTSYSPNHIGYTKVGLSDTGRKIAGGASLGLIALGAGLAGKETYHAVKMASAQRRTTAKGHAKAVAKRNAWAKEMDNAFRGQPYDRTRKKKNKYRRVQV